MPVYTSGAGLASVTAPQVPTGANANGGGYWRSDYVDQCVVEAQLAALLQVGQEVRAGSAAVTGGGVATAAGGKGAGGPVVVTGGGSAAVSGGKAAASGVAVTGGGVPAATGSKQALSPAVAVAASLVFSDDFATPNAADYDHSSWVPGTFVSDGAGHLSTDYNDYGLSAVDTVVSASPIGVSLDLTQGARAQMKFHVEAIGGSHIFDVYVGPADAELTGMFYYASATIISAPPNLRLDVGDATFTGPLTVTGDLPSREGWVVIKVDGTDAVAEVWDTDPSAGGTPVLTNTLSGIVPADASDRALFDAIFTQAGSWVDDFQVYDGPEILAGGSSVPVTGGGTITVSSSVGGAASVTGGGSITVTGTHGYTVALTGGGALTSTGSKDTLAAIEATGGGATTATGGDKQTAGISHVFAGGILVATATKATSGTAHVTGTGNVTGGLRQPARCTAVDRVVTAALAKDF